MVEYKYDAWGNHDVYGLNKVNGIEVLQDIYKKNAPAFAEEYLKYKQLVESNPFRYRGYYYDTETDLYYLQTRYYDPEVGRFISQDSIEYADPETINGLNLYAYCGNNPVMRVDPEGTEWWHWLVGILVVAAVTVAMVSTAGLAAVVVGASAAVTTSMCVGAGVATATAGIINLVTQASQGVEEFNLGSLLCDMLISGTIGMITGGISAGIGALSTANLTATQLLINKGMQVGANVLISTVAYFNQSAIKGDNPTLYGFGISIMSGVISGFTFNYPEIQSFFIGVGLEIAGYGEDIVNIIKRAIKNLR